MFVDTQWTSGPAGGGHAGDAPLHSGLGDHTNYCASRMAGLNAETPVMYADVRDVSVNRSEVAMKVESTPSCTATHRLGQGFD